MQKIITLIAVYLYSNFAVSQTVIGKWKTIDDVTGKEKSIVEIYEKSGKIYGKIIEIIDPIHAKDLCVKCTESDSKNKPIVGLIIIKDLKKDGEEYNSGKILDPKTGKLYKCTLELDGADKLKVRGYIGISLLGRSQLWIRIK
jgi:uncharacterized protein (DUF2147 family)